MDHYNNIKNLIENNLVEIKKQEISVNRYTLMTYYNVGKSLVEAQGGKERAKYGNKLIKEYSKKLTEEFGRGYDYSNLSRMRQLYITFEKVGSPTQQLTGTHYYKILPLKNESERNYYINIVVKNRLSVRELINEIKNESFYRLKSKENIKLDQENEQKPNILDMIKDPILININQVSLERVTEKALKKLMIENISRTMLELGIGFSYVGSEQRLKLDNTYHYADLVFFNIELNSYVIIELKINKLNIRELSQIEFYVNYYDDEIRKPFHNKTIGIIVTKKNDKEITKRIPKENIIVTTYKVTN